MFLRCFFACCVFGFCQVAGETPIYALLGKEAFLKTDIKTPPDEILWKHTGNKVVEFNGNIEELFGSFKGRVSMDWHSADLTISDARFEDSGQYELETFTKNLLHRTQYNLEVIDKVTKPTISCEMMKGNSSHESGHKATLTCSAESKQSQSLMKFHWSPNGNGQLGPKLIIPLGDEHDNQEYSCIVSNPLTEESATFSTKKCYPDENSSIPIIVGICVPVIVILIIAVVILLCCKGYFKCFKCEKTNDLENQKDHEIEDSSEMGNGGVETESLLGRAPTLPSNQRLIHSVQSNKDTHLTQNDQVINELRESFHKRLSAENKNQDPSTSSSSPAPEKPPRSQDLPAEDKDQAEEDERGETVEETLALDHADSGMINDAMSKQGSEWDKMIVSPFAPEKPPRQEALPDLKKSINKRDSHPPPVLKKSASVKEYKTKANENKPLEESKELPDQNSDEKDKVTKCETSLQLSLVPETTVLKSPVHESSDPQKPVPESFDPQPPVPKTPVPVPRLHLSLASPKSEHEEDPSSDQVGKPEMKSSEESGLLGSGQESKKLATISSEPTDTVTAHEQQQPVTETNQREETLQDKDKQVPEENQKPDGEGDQEEMDPPFNTLKEPQSNSKADTSPMSPDASQAIPDHKDQDKTRHSSHSETGPEKEDKSETSEGKNKDPS